MIKTLLLSLAVCLLAGVCLAHDDQLTTVVPINVFEELVLSEDYSASLFACHVPQKSARVLDASRRTLHGRDVVQILADRDYNGKADMTLLYDVVGEKDTAAFPHYYVYDTNFDGQPDKAYRDMNGNGVCQEMQEVPLEYILSEGKGA